MKRGKLSEKEIKTLTGAWAGSELGYAGSSAQN